MAPHLSLSLLVAVLLALRCLGELIRAGDSRKFKLVRAVEAGQVQFECQSTALTAGSAGKSAVKQLRLTKAGALVFERHGQFPASIGSGYFHRLRVASPTPRRHEFNLTGLTEADEGWYRCSLELESGETAAQTFQLKLWLLPRFELNASTVASSTILLHRQPGEYAVLRCPTFRGRPWPTVSWLMNERAVSNHDRFRIDPLLPDQLHVYDLNCNDSGRYACRIANAYGVEEFHFTLLVRATNPDGTAAAPIAFIHRPPPTLAKPLEGSRLELPCGFYADPQLRARARTVWQRARSGSDHWATISAQSDPSVAQAAQNGSLVFLPLHHRHAGTYRCLVRLKGADGSEKQLASRASELVVLHPPTALANASLTQFLPLGKPGSLTCPVTASPRVDHTEWSRDGSPIGAAFSGRRFRFSLVTPTHAGNYRCRALQAGRSFNSWSSWTPEFGVRTVQPPRFVRRPLPLYQLLPGGSARLPCAFWSPPEVGASLVWLRNGRRLDYRDQRLVYDPLAQSLSVRNAQSDLEGTYTCALANPVMPLAASAQLRVELVSPNPPANLTIAGVTPYSISLRWQPAFIAGRAIRYIVWYRRLGSAWQSQLADPPSATEATVTGLVADTDYQLSLTSVTSDRFAMEMRVRPEVTPARTAGFSPELATMPLPFDRSGRPIFPPIERDLGPRPGAPEAVNFTIVGNGILRVHWRPPAMTPIPVLYYRLDLPAWQSGGAGDIEGSWEPLVEVLEARASLSIADLPLLRSRVIDAAANGRRLRVAATACALLSRSQRVVVADVDASQLHQLLPAGSAAASVAAAGFGRVPAGAAWALLSCLLSFLVLAGAFLGLTRSSSRRSLGRRVVVVNGTDPEGSKLHREAASVRRRPHRCRTRRCCCRQQLQPANVGAFNIGASGISSEHPALLLRDRRASDPESGFHSAMGGAWGGGSDDDDADGVPDVQDDDVSVSDIESTLPPGSWQVHGWSRRLPISVYLASYHRIRRLRRASFPVFRESDLL